MANIQENILCAKEERRFLLKKLIEHENEIDSQYGGGAVVPGGGVGIHLNSGNFNDFSSTPIKKTIKKRSNSEATSEASTKSRGGNVAKKLGKSLMSKKHAAQNISLPISLTGFVLHSLGEIVFDRPGYHSESCIYPVGYTITRTYSHLRDTEQKCLYTCKIIDNGDSPRFEIIPDVDTEFVISGPSPDYCHTTLLQLIHSATDSRNTNIRPQGEWFFGLADPAVVNLIQNNPAVRRCTNFKGFQTSDGFTQEMESNLSPNFEALQKHLTIAAYHTVPEIKEEPPDELLDHSDMNNFNVC